MENVEIVEFNTVSNSALQICASSNKAYHRIALSSTELLPCYKSIFFSDYTEHGQVVALLKSNLCTASYWEFNLRSIKGTDQN